MSSPKVAGLTPDMEILQVFHQLDAWVYDQHNEFDQKRFWALLTVLRGPDWDLDEHNQELVDCYTEFKRRTVGLFRRLLMPSVPGIVLEEEDEGLEPQERLAQLALWLDAEDLDDDLLPDGYRNWRAFGRQHFSWHFMHHLSLAMQALNHELQR